ncbi:MAG: hypothetical protein A2W10_03665 [Deltaproteobacteria bacterium RBG_16_55_12]|nr:MAG: hypothetical protein A2W10_03665 [Deltaproteobacteria bacterium RBG_16_55_12]
MGQCFNRTFPLLRLRSPASPPRSRDLPVLVAKIDKFHMRVRGSAEQAESTETERFDETTGLLLSAREAGPRTELSAKRP